MLWLACMTGSPLFHKTWTWKFKSLIPKHIGSTSNTALALFIHSSNIHPEMFDQKSPAIAIHTWHWNACQHASSVIGSDLYDLLLPPFIVKKVTKCGYARHLCWKKTENVLFICWRQQLEINRHNFVVQTIFNVQMQPEWSDLSAMSPELAPTICDRIS